MMNTLILGEIPLSPMSCNPLPKHIKDYFYSSMQI